MFFFFFAENVKCKSYSYFFSKNSVNAIFNDQNFNDLTNYIVSFEQLGPASKTRSLWNVTLCSLLLSFRHLGKTFFVCRFISNENLLFWLTISYQPISVFCSQIFTLKLNLRLKVGLTYAISLVKWFFGIFVKENIFYFPLLNLNYWCFSTILWKFQKNWTSGTIWKSRSKLPTLQISAWFGFIFTMGKSENIWFF